MWGRLAATILFALCLTVPASAAELILSEPFPMIGTKVQVSLVDAEDGPEGFELTATMRPNSATERKSVVGAFGPDGALLWTPTDEGITLLTATREGSTVHKNVAVKFASAPASGIAMMLIAGTVLFGGIFVSIRRVLRS